MSAGAEQLTRSAQNGWIESTTLGVVSESFAYTSFGEPSAQTSSASGMALYSRQDTRDALGRVVSRSETVAGESLSITYGYDVQGRLATATRGGVTVSYSYDANGNRTQVQGGGLDATATYDEQDRLVRYGDATYAWTPSGSLKTKTTAAGATRYTYDLRGALREVILADGRQLSYVIDGHGRRVGKKVGGQLVQGMLYQSALQPVAERDGSGAVKSTFVYASHANVPDYLVRGGVAYKLITDLLGSVRLVVNTQTGEIAQRIDYDEFGRVLKDTAPGFQPFGFAGGLCLQLNLTPQQEEVLDRALGGDQGGYSAPTNNCGDPVESGLEDLGFDLGLNITPPGLRDALESAGLVTSSRRLDAWNPYSPPWVPWAGK